ncbi:MAG: MFS transporter [Bacteroidia bacterium]|nr:MFS transporter [Bacteroidia bacterium]
MRNLSNIELNTTSRIITRPILIVSLVSLLTDIASEMLYPIMPMYLKSIGFTIVGIGILEGFVEAFAGISKGYFGHLSDRLGKRVPFIRLGYAFSALAKPLMALLTLPVWIFLMRTFERLGKGIRTSARDAFLSDHSTPETKGRVFGFHRSLDTVGAAIGPFIALLVLYFLPERYRFLFVISVIPGILAVLFTFLIKDSLHKPEVKPTGKSFFAFLAYWKCSSSTYKFVIIGLLAFTLINSSDAFILLGLKQKGYSDTQVIAFYIFYNLVYALTSYPIGRLSDRIGQKRVLVVGLILFAAVYGLFGFLSSTGALAIVFVLYGIYASSTEGISKAMITNLSGKGDTATALGFYTGLASLCTLLASTLSGILWTLWSLRVMFLVSAAGALLVVGYFLIYFRFSHRIIIN